MEGRADLVSSLANAMAQLEDLRQRRLSSSCISLLLFSSPILRIAFLNTEIKQLVSRGGSLLGKVEVQAEIKILIEERNKRTGLKADDVVRELAAIGFANITNCLDKDGKPRNLEDNLLRFQHH